MAMWDDGAEFQSMVGKTFASVERRGDDEIIFTTDTGDVYKMFHSQDCCESVTIEDIVGDLSDLVGSPVLHAEVATNKDNPKTETWGDGTHAYKLATIAGHVDIRWYGSSNGYYSEEVDFVKVD